jgi:hypothetical protein
MSSLRANPEIQALFKSAEARHLTDAEYQEYLRLAPQNADRVTAAREVALAEPEVIRASLQEVFALYPYAQHHFLASEKCPRDVAYVSAYATHAMLQDDPDWFRDKLLIWLRTILQAFEFPARNQEPTAAIAYHDITAKADAMPQRVASIYETYARVQRRYQETLTPASYQLMAASLRQPVDVLTVL